MTKLLEQAVARAKGLPDSEQDAIARIVLDEIESEKKWDSAIAKSPEKLRKLADRALDDYRAGKTRELDSDKL